MKNQNKDLAIMIGILVDAKTLLESLQRSNSSIPNNLRDFFRVQYTVANGASRRRLDRGANRYLNYIRALWTRCFNKCGVEWTSFTESMFFNRCHGNEQQCSQPDGAERLSSPAGGEETTVVNETIPDHQQSPDAAQSPPVRALRLVRPCADCGAQPAPVQSDHCWWCGQQTKIP